MGLNDIFYVLVIIFIVIILFIWIMKLLCLGGGDVDVVMVGVY